MEKILPYDRNVVPQETFYWCGPASTQVVLNSRGIKESEQKLAAELGTTVNGTNYVGQVTQVLNRRLGGGYVIRGIENDPPRADQVDLLWADVLSSINAGFGVVANIVAPVSNYPRGTRGSASPAYGGGTVYHYIAIMGYADDGKGGRHLWIADSGFRPFGYWCSLAKVASLIAGKGYTVKPVAAPASFLSHLSDAEQRELLSVVRDIFRQLAGANFAGWSQGGGRTLYDLNAATAARKGVSGTRDTKASK